MTRRVGATPALSPVEPEYRESLRSPAPAASLDELFAEMTANDDEFRAWRDAETRADLAGGR